MFSLPSDASESETDEAIEGDDKLDGFGDSGFRDLRIVHKMYFRFEIISLWNIKFYIPVARNDSRFFDVFRIFEAFRFFIFNRWILASRCNYARFEWQFSLCKTNQRLLFWKWKYFEAKKQIVTSLSITEYLFVFFVLLVGCPATQRFAHLKSKKNSWQFLSRFNFAIYISSKRNDRNFFGYSSHVVYVITFRKHLNSVNLQRKVQLLLEWRNRRWHGLKHWVWLSLAAIIFQQLDVKLWKKWIFLTGILFKST